MKDDETKATLEVPKPDLDELIANNNRLYDRIRELEDTVQALLYALRKANNERLVNDDACRHFQEMYVKEQERANKLFEKYDKNINKSTESICPYCGSNNIQFMYERLNLGGSGQVSHYLCKDCHKEFDV